MASRTVKQMVMASLKCGGYDGLFHPDGECGCELSDLAPCGEIGLDCTAGYKTTVCPPGLDGACDFYIVPQSTVEEK